MTISKRTIRSLRAAASSFFSDNDAYHVWLGHEYEVDSTLELTEKQGKEAVRAINDMQREQRQREAGSRRPGQITFKQQEYIEGLFDMLEIPDGPRRFGFVEKQIGVKKSVRWLNKGEATKVINGLKRFSESQYAHSNEN